MKFLIFSFIFISSLNAQANSLCEGYFTKKLITKIEDLPQELYEKIYELAKVEIEAGTAKSAQERDIVFARVNEELENLQAFGVEASIYQIVRSRALRGLRSSFEQTQTVENVKRKNLVEQNAAFALEQQLTQKYYTSDLTEALVRSLYEKSPDVELILNNPLLFSKLDLQKRINYEKETLLHITVRSGHAKATEFLLDRGANIEAVDKDGLTALLRAIRYGHTDIATLLINRRADIEAKGIYGKTALHYAIEHKKTDIATLLINRDANIDAKDTDGETVLHYAIMFKQTDIATLLINRGANTEAVDNRGRAALQFARDYNNTKIIELLEKHKKDSLKPKSLNQKVKNFGSKP